MDEMKQKKRGPLFYLRCLISIVLIAVVLNRVGFEALFNNLLQAKWEFVLLSISFTPLLIAVSAWKWQIILKAQDIHVSLLRLFWLYVVGYFYNTVLPTNVGGDVVRAYALGKQTGKNAQSFSSVFIERFTGLTALLLMALLAFAFAIYRLWDVRLTVLLVISVAGYFVLLLFFFNKKLIDKISTIKLPLLNKIIRKLNAFQAATMAFRSKRRTLIFAMANSVLFYVLAVLNVFVSSLAFDADMTLLEALTITPIVLVITMIPISIGGIGLAEGAYVFTFQRFGMTGAMGLSVALLMRAKALLAGIVGGIYYASRGMDEKLKSEEKSRQVDDGDVEGIVNYYSGFEDVMRRKKSPLQKYQDIVIGNYKLRHLIKYEVIVLFFGVLPGILGHFFRKVFYPLLFGGVGKGTIFDRAITIRHGNKIKIGRRCVISEYCGLTAQGDDASGIKLGNEVLLGRGTVLNTRNGTIELGDFCNIGANCRLGTTTKIKFGKHVLLAANCYIGGIKHCFDRTDIPIMRQGYESKGGVVIEDDVWLGAGVMVLDGVTIGTGCVVAAGSIVTRDLPAYSIAMGSPAKVTYSRQKNNPVV
jgi:uncharacterized protein (TIRG00374 family)